MMQEVVWETMAEFRCPPCAVEDHWNHQRPGQRQPVRGPAVGVGECRTFEGIHEQRCACSWRPEVVPSPERKEVRDGQTS